MMNLLVLNFIDTFESIYSKSKNPILYFERDFKNFNNVWKKFCKNNHYHYISERKFNELYMGLKVPLRIKLKDSMVMLKEIIKLGIPM